MRRKILVLFGLIILTVLILYVWWQQAIKPINPLKKQPVDFFITRGEPIRNIADRLQKEGLIRSPLAFFILSRFFGFGELIQSGDFILNPSMDLLQITTKLTHGTSDVKVIIPEGWRIEEIAMTLSKQLNIPESEFIKTAKEGYMFPDTYFFPKNATSNTVSNIMIDNFNKKISPNLLNKISLKKMSLNDVIIIASLVEREAKYPEDRPLIASVILNRLELNMKLDIDATIQYALGYQEKEKDWWKKELTLEDLSVDSFYNTYKNSGLPPAPIANPGLLSIEAVIDAPKTEYIFYLADKNGKSHFSKNIEEHNKNISTFLNK